MEERAEALIAYFPHPLPAPLRARLRALADPARGIAVCEPERFAGRDWEAEWRRGLAPRRIGPIWVRPSWCAPAGAPELVIDPKQAFGSGEHASTRLALELLARELRAGDRVLDLGAGSGILGLAALRLGAQSAVGVEVDAVACRCAHENRRENDLGLGLACGTLACLADGAHFDLAVANILWARLEPELPGLCARARRSLVVSGQLEREQDAVEAALAEAGWAVGARAVEAQSGDRWSALVAHPRDRQSASRSASVSSSG